MNRLLLFVILSGFTLLFDVYAYQGLRIAIGSWPEILQRSAKIFFWSLTVCTILSFLLYEPLSASDKGRRVLMVLATIGVANILGKLLFVLWLLVDDAIRFFKWIWMKLNPSIEPEEGGISRSEFLAGAGALSAAIPLLTMGWGVLSGAHDYTVKKRTLKLAGLPPSFEGFKIVQISDLHVGSFWSRSSVEKGVTMINEQNADLVMFTGDLVNNRADELKDWIPVFNKIKAKHGVYSVLGNHDYGDYVPWDSPEEKAANLEALIKMQREELGWDLLMDENRRIVHGNDSIALLGVQNWGDKGRFPKYGDLKKALQGSENEPVKLLMSHDPSHWRGQILNDFKDIDVTFSGHTHGMQFGIEVGSIKWSPVKYFYPEWADLYQDGKQFLYVNRGFGYIGYPGRFGILPEITVFELQGVS